MKICIKCNEKEAVGYKYCAECKIQALRESDERSRKKARERNKKPCTICQKELTNTKYCRSCAQTAKTERQRAIRADAKKRRARGVRLDPNDQQPKAVRGSNKEKGAINPYYLVRGNPSNSTRLCSITAGGM